MIEHPIPDWTQPKEFTLEQMKALSKTAASMRPVTYERALQEMIKRFETIEAENADLIVLNDTYSEECNRLDEQCRNFSAALMDWENREAAVCPEDVSFEEVIAQLTAQVSALSKPVSDEEWLDLCAGDHVHIADVQRHELDLIIAARLAAAQKSTEQKPTEKRRLNNGPCAAQIVDCDCLWCLPSATEPIPQKSMEAGDSIPSSAFCANCGVGEMRMISHTKDGDAR